MFFCIIIQRKVINLRNATNNNICESISSNTTDWNSINWNKIEMYVDKQQKRIYKAEVENRHRDVRNIQRRLTRSKAVILLAVRRVTKINKGRKTAGIDGFVRFLFWGANLYFCFSKCVFASIVNLQV